MILTMAPETAFVQGGQSAYGGIWGAYLPVIHGLRDSLDLLHVQLYNSGSMYGINAQIYQQGTADFIVAMCEAVIQGFNTAGGPFIGLPASKVAVGLPACTSAAGGGFCHPDTVKAAIQYLRGLGPNPGTYTLSNAAGYPTLRGMMTWSINWDAVSTCGSSYEYANNYVNIFATPTSLSSATQPDQGFQLYPNPARDVLQVQLNSPDLLQETLRIYNGLGQLVHTQNVSAMKLSIPLSTLATGLYILRIKDQGLTIVKE